jgi:hypothetical protein
MLRKHNAPNLHNGLWMAIFRGKRAVAHLRTVSRLSYDGSR